jgi:hypothetical protein
VHSLAVNSEPEKVVGQVSRHSRAIACTKGGYFESISTVSNGVYDIGLKICCGPGFTVWWEGLEGEGQQCADLGGTDGTTSVAQIITLDV